MFGEKSIDGSRLQHSTRAPHCAAHCLNIVLRAQYLGTVNPFPKRPFGPELKEGIDLDQDDLLDKIDVSRFCLKLDVLAQLLV